MRLGIIVALCCAMTTVSIANASDNLSEIKKFETSLKIGASKHNVGFDTPAAHSVLSWDNDTIDLGIDIKYNFSNKTFTMLEYDYGKIKGGKSADDDVQNGSGEYSVHGVDGRSNNYKLYFGHEVLKRRTISFSPTAGIFYKDIKVTSTDGSGVGGSYGSGINFEGYGNQTHSKYMGLMAGLRIGNKTVNTKGFLQADLLIPLRYEGDQIWYGRDPDLHWKLRNSSSSGGYGFRIKGEYGYKINKFFVQYAKLYAYYEEVNVDDLTESEEGVTLPSAIEGSADYQSFGAGIAFEF